MTMSQGLRIQAAPCCGARYRYPNYTYLNFMAFEHWTDGWCNGTLMPTDEGLRQCRCGQFLLQQDLVTIEFVETSDLPFIDHVQDQQLPACIAQAQREDLELAARLEYWRCLNHPYRRQYHQYRQAEEAAHHAAWQACQAALGNHQNGPRQPAPPAHQRLPGSTFSYPPFQPTQEQRDNMRRASQLLATLEPQTQPRNLRERDRRLTLAELYREQSLFEQAEQVLAGFPPDERDMADKLIRHLTHQKDPAPIRFRM